MDEENKEQTLTEEEKVSEGADDTAVNVKEEAETSEEGKEEKAEDTAEGDEPSDETSKEDEENPEDKEEDAKKDEFKDIDPKNVGKEEASNVLKDKGFNYSELQKEFNETGDISKETREKLAEVGITEEIVNNYIEGQKARVEQEINDIAECIGGREQLNEVIQWAAQNLSDEEKVVINSINDAQIMKVYLKDLKNRMEEKEGKVPETTLNGDGGKPTIELFESQAQMFEAIRDPKYKTDEAYRAKVMKKIQASREAGIDLGI